MTYSWSPKGSSQSYPPLSSVLKHKARAFDLNCLPGRSYLEKSSFPSSGICLIELAPWG